MICAYSSICDACGMCCGYFSAYIAFILEIAQLLNFVIIVVYIIFIKNFLEGELKSAVIMAIVAAVFNAIHNIVTTLIAGFRGNNDLDISNLKMLLCCYIYCPNCGCCWDSIMGVFGCTCIVELIDCFDTYPQLMVLVIIQIVSSIITYVLELKSTDMIDKENFFSDIVFFIGTLFFVIAILNNICNIICMIHYFATCKTPVSKANNSDDQIDDNNDDQPDQNNVQITQPNQNDNGMINPATFQNNLNLPYAYNQQYPTNFNQPNNANQQYMFDPNNPYFYNQQNVQNQQYNNYYNPNNFNQQNPNNFNQQNAQKP